MSYQPTELDERVKATTLQILEQMELLRTGTDSALEGIDYGEQDTAILIAQLFTKLDLDVPTEIESSHVETKTVEETKTSDSYLVSFASIHTVVLFGTDSCTTVTTRRSTSNPRLMTNQQSSPFKWANMDVMFSTGLWVHPSPYNELYPFPASPQNAQKSSVFSIEADFQSILDAFLGSVDSEIQQRLCKIEKLRQLCPVNHLGLITEMWEVVLMYWDEEKYPEAEYWGRQLSRCPPSPDTQVHELLIKSRLLLSVVLFMQRKLKEAKDEHQIVHQLVLSSSGVHEILIEPSLSIGGAIAESLHENKDSESWFRQLAQLKLTAYGPRSEDTISTLRHLAEAMLSQRRYSESEELLWIMVDLAKTSLKSTDRATTKLSCSLARLMFKQGRFEDAENLWRMSLEIARTRWGSEDSVALKAETGLARVLKSQGRLAESEKLLRGNVEKLVRVRGEDSLITSTSMEHLGSLLMEDGRYADAAIWWEKCTKIRLLKLGPTDDTAFETFSVLIECYLQLGGYNDALKSGQEWLEAAKKASGLNHIYVSQLQSLLETMLVEKLSNFQPDVPMRLF
jgi:tetratricopeptide (TPR) repeat protein